MRFWIILFLFHASTKCEQFYYKLNVPKCCKVNEILVLNYTCIRDEVGALYIQTPSTLPKFPIQNAVCVEIMLDERNGEKYIIKIDPKGGNTYMVGLNYFPKCCPQELTYDTIEHKCVARSKLPSLSQELFKGSNGIAVMSVGLSKCDTVIADYELPTVRSIIFDLNHGVFVPQLQKSVGLGTYCVEKIFNSHRYVVRVCHSDFNVCRTKKFEKNKVRCVRKCCADGEIFQHRPAECVKKFGHGLALRNDTNIHYPNEPFAIIQGGRCLSYMGTEDDVYHMDVRGNVRLKIEDSPWLFLSPFKASYCYEYYDDDELQYIFFCVR